MVTDKLLEFVVNSVRYEEKVKLEKEKEAEEKTRALRPGNFWTDVAAETLVEPAKTKATHHREREKVWTTRLEEAEKKLKEEGVSVDIYDNSTGAYAGFGGVASIASGAMSIQGMQNQNFQPRVDQKMLDATKHAKNKMLEHRGKAEQYEKYSKAFALDPTRLIRLTVEEIHYFGL